MTDLVWTTNVAYLEALPARTIVVSQVDMLAWQKHPYGGWDAAKWATEDWPVGELLECYGPVAVVWVPA